MAVDNSVQQPPVSQSLEPGLGTSVGTMVGLVQLVCRKRMGSRELMASPLERVIDSPQERIGLYSSTYESECVVVKGMGRT